MSDKLTIDKLIDDVKNALTQYSSENIDVMKDYNDMLYVIYHSKNNSFPVSGNMYPSSKIDFKKLETELDKLNVGHVW